MKYKVTFTLFGKTINCTISGNSKDDAEYKLRGKLKIITIDPVKEKTPDVVNDIMSMFK